MCDFRRVLWTTWLRLPQSVRGSVYRFLIAFSKPSSNGPDLKKLPFGLYAKVGDWNVMQEAFALQYVADYTTIPVPEVLDLFQDTTNDSQHILILYRLPGTPLSSTLLTSLSEDQKTSIANVLREWLNQLQSLHSPYSRAVCGYLGGAFSSYRINATTPFIPPFASQDRFHEHPCSAMTLEHDPKVRSLAAVIRQKRYDIVLAHGNLSPENVLVMVDEDTNNGGGSKSSGGIVPVGLVGWECAAWMPSYWDLTAGAWAVKGRPGESVWSHILIRCLPQYSDELKVDKELWKTYTPY